MGARGCRSGVPVQSGKAALELGLPPALGARLRPHRPLDPQPTLFTPVIAAHHHHPPWAALCTPVPAKGFPSSDHKLPGIQGPPPRFSPGLHSLRLPEEGYSSVCTGFACDLHTLIRTCKAAFQ